MAALSIASGHGFVCKLATVIDPTTAFLKMFVDFRVIWVYMGDGQRLRLLVC